MTIDDIISADNFSLQFFKDEVFAMDGFKCNSFQEFYKLIRKGFCYGSQYTIKVKIGKELIDYKEFKNILRKSGYMRNYNKVIDSLKPAGVALHSVEEKDDYDILTFYGGLNGRGDFYRYLEQVMGIVSRLELEFNVMWDIWLINWINDCLDDVWTLKIGIRNKHNINEIEK